MTKEGRKKLTTNKPEKKNKNNLSYIYKSKQRKRAKDEINQINDKRREKKINHK